MVIEAGCLYLQVLCDLTHTQAVESTLLEQAGCRTEYGFPCQWRIGFLKCAGFMLIASLNLQHIAVQVEQVCTLAIPESRQLCVTIRAFLSASIR